MVTVMMKILILELRDSVEIQKHEYFMFKKKKKLRQTAKLNLLPGRNNGFKLHLVDDTE